MQHRTVVVVTSRHRKVRRTQCIRLDTPMVKIIATNLGCLYVKKKVNFDFQLNLLLPKLKSFGMIRQETELITFEHAQCSS